MNIPLERKVWGAVRHAFVSDACAVSILEVTQGFRCSRHYHRHRINRFIVQSGAIQVVTSIRGTGTRECTILQAGDMLDVQPGVEHWFEVVESGIVVEVYFAPALRLDDIVRLDVGEAITSITVNRKVGLSVDTRQDLDRARLEAARRNG
jgi:mannose-6-phosphate isomerase-like protein (cupin superfamily)